MPWAPGHLGTCPGDTNVCMRMPCMHAQVPTGRLYPVFVCACHAMHASAWWAWRDMACISVTWHGVREQALPWRGMPTATACMSKAAVGDFTVVTWALALAYTDCREAGMLYGYLPCASSAVVACAFAAPDCTHALNHGFCQGVTFCTVTGTYCDCAELILHMSCDRLVLCKGRAVSVCGTSMQSRTAYKWY